MIHVLPGRSFQLNDTKRPEDHERLVQDVTKLIRAASPFLDSVEIVNRTKAVNVDVVFQRGKVQIIVTNPQDQIFDLNELENPVTPVHITGR